MTPLLINVAGRYNRRRHRGLEPFLRMEFGGKHKSGVEPPQSKSAGLFLARFQLLQVQLSRRSDIRVQTFSHCCMPSLSHTWGTTSTERQIVFPCDRIISTPDDQLFRGVTIRASPEMVFRWLCQMRVAPYSYDWIDNGGRQSPRELLPALENLSIGQDVMKIFDLVDFERDRHLTLRVKPGTRLLVKLIAKFPSGIRGRFMRAVLPWGDLVMMRRQLLNFKQLAERNVGGGAVVSSQ